MEDVDDFFKYLASKIKDPVPGKNRKCCILLIGMYIVQCKQKFRTLPSKWVSYITNQDINYDFCPPLYFVKKYYAKLLSHKIFFLNVRSISKVAVSGGNSLITTSFLARTEKGLFAGFMRGAKAQRILVKQQNSTIQIFEFINFGTYFFLVIFIKDSFYLFQTRRY